MTRMKLFARHKGNKIVLLITLIAVISIIAVIVTVFLIRRSDSAAADSKETTQRILRETGDIYILPTGENPTVAAIQDKAKLPKQDFFQHAQTGDYLLIYPKARVALLYRDSVKKLVNVGPINLPKQSEENQ